MTKPTAGLKFWPTERTSKFAFHLSFGIAERRAVRLRSRCWRRLRGVDVPPVQRQVLVAEECRGRQAEVEAAVWRASAPARVRIASRVHGADVGLRGTGGASAAPTVKSSPMRPSSSPVRTCEHADVLAAELAGHLGAEADLLRRRPCRSGRCGG